MAATVRKTATIRRQLTVDEVAEFDVQRARDGRFAPSGKGAGMGSLPAPKPGAGEKPAGRGGATKTHSAPTPGAGEKPPGSGAKQKPLGPPKLPKDRVSVGAGGGKDQTVRRGMRGPRSNPGIVDWEKRAAAGKDAPRTLPAPKKTPGEKPPGRGATQRSLPAPKG